MVQEAALLAVNVAVAGLPAALAVAVAEVLPPFFKHCIGVAVDLRDRGRGRGGRRHAARDLQHDHAVQRDLLAGRRALADDGAFRQTAADLTHGRDQVGRVDRAAGGGLVKPLDRGHIGRGRAGGLGHIHRDGGAAFDLAARRRFGADDRVFGYAVVCLAPGRHGDTQIDQRLLGGITVIPGHIGQADDLGAAADLERDLLAFLDGTPCGRRLLEDGPFRVHRVIFIDDVRRELGEIIGRAEFVLGLADKVDELDVGAVGEQRVAGIGKDQVHKDGRADDKGHRHTKEDGQHGEAPLLDRRAAAGR